MKNPLVKMLAVVAIATAVAFALILLAACKPADPDAPAPADYTIWLTALSDDEKEENVIREVDCTIIAYKADAVVLIRDETTGETRPYEVDVESFTPIHIPIRQAVGNADRIEYICTMYGTLGDSLTCDVVDAKGNPAPLTGSIDFDLIEKGKKGDLLPATCLGVITVQS